jgi:ubiquinone/menaquinone biosynthesis C-methylase UbiE
MSPTALVSACAASASSTSPAAISPSSTKAAALGLHILEGPIMSKIDQVRSFFETPQGYLVGSQFNIRIRIETVQEFTKNLTFDRVLDIGCGDGSISLPLLARSKRLTLLDVSTNMLDLARNKIPLERAHDVDLINRNFVGANLEPESFDLVLCIGVLAHVDSPAAVISEIARIAKPGACVVLQFTDRFHFWGVPYAVYSAVYRRLLKQEPYTLNRLSRRQVMRLCQKEHLNISAVYRYGLPPLGTSRFAGQDERYKMSRHVFGPSYRNRNRWMGNEFICRLEKA